MSKTKKIFLSILTVAGIVGLVYFVIFQVKVYNTIVLLNKENALTQMFLIQSFPDQVKTFNATLK